MKEFYHLTSKKAFTKIAAEGFVRPGRRMIISSFPEIPNLCSKSAIFGTVFAEDPKWCTEEFHLDQPVIDTIIKDISTGDDERILLLKINAENIDNIYVADWGVHLADDYMGDRHTPKNILKRVKLEYANSLVPFSEYTHDMDYKLPEVVCFSKIPAENLQIEFSTYTGKLRNDIRRKYNKEILPEAWETPHKKPCKYFGPMHFAM